jgi:hypothetical protein
VGMSKLLSVVAAECLWLARRSGDDASVAPMVAARNRESMSDRGDMMMFLLSMMNINTNTKIIEDDAAMYVWIQFDSTRDDDEVNDFTEQPTAASNHHLVVGRRVIGGKVEFLFSDDQRFWIDAKANGADVSSDEKQDLGDLVVAEKRAYLLI